MARPLNIDKILYGFCEMLRQSNPDLYREMTPEELNQCEYGTYPFIVIGSEAEDRLGQKNASR